MEITYHPTGQRFGSAQEAVDYLEDDGEDGARAHLLVALNTKLAEHGDALVSCTSWQVQWYDT